MESDGVRVKTFSKVFEGKEVNFYILCMKQSFLLWASVDTSFPALSVAMKTRFNSIPVSTHLFGDSTNSSSSTLSIQLAKKTGCQVFVSLNIKEPSLRKAAEEHIFQLLESDPSSFFIQ